MRERLRRTFGEDAARYDRARPGYPAAVFEDFGAGTRVLEIGCGTGQATVALAERGCAVTAVELSADLAAVASAKLAGFPAVTVETGDFEQRPRPPEPFDVVLAATAFHWLDPRTRMAKAADALRAGGTLALITTHHVAGGSERFFADVQRWYERFDPATPPGLRLSAAADVPTTFDESGRFAPPRFRRWEWEQEYTTAEYTDLLMTYSNHRALPPERREGLLAAITSLIDDEHGGRITKRYLTELATAVRA
ncbi:class I SAM-dependent methyltransferase [Amycolatopsis sp. PS_44_ISF1]|uniref:class I SAM-dependent methyltransferase n=1 Tax=Amycolatopsis sp. PS_44_ISF1 TaxID=2974917 RepID=UPI0028E02763|nr:class I SAM-dependent methyltransferase [Amycolatopsis sp. PS_44_ISF1]MDT8911597.1 class I SAM-dependent methyltransferase [Amycolatopsis sp. PS_44_ISF1]